MEKSKVYFTDMRALPGTSLPQKLQKLMRRTGIADIDFERKITAIKMHFGEPGNLSYLRPNYAKAVADLVKELGGRPVLSDCNTRSVGRRKDALEHLSAAYENGFGLLSTGCHVIIGDGLKGTDDVYVPVHGGELVKEAKIGKAVMDAHGAIRFDEQRHAGIDHDRCVGCGRCLGACNFDAVYNSNDSAVKEMNMKMAEYTKAVLDGRPHFHVSLAIEISPYCDCHPENDTPILPNIGMFASFDPVALDQACADACNAAAPLAGSLLDEHMHDAHFHDHHDHFRNTTPESEWQTCLEHAEKIGVGTRAYELIRI